MQQAEAVLFRGLITTKLLFMMSFVSEMYEKSKFTAI